MRTLGLYQIYDSQSQMAVGPLMKAVKAAQAIRDFHDVLKDERTTLGQHPEDYKLIYVGEQNEETGEIAGSNVLMVASGTQWVHAQAQAAAQDKC